MNKKLFPKSYLILALSLGLSSLDANALSITTTFAGSNSFAGNMFDVTTFGNALDITALDVNINPGTTNISVYTRPGTYVGFTDNSAGWTLQGTVNVTSAGAGNATFVDIADFTLAANSLTGFYVTNSDYSSNAISMNYTNGSNTYSNADLQLGLGIGKADPDFTGGTFSPRTWNGTIYYTLNNAAVPEPATLALFTVGLAGFGVRRVRHT